MGLKQGLGAGTHRVRWMLLSQPLQRGFEQRVGRGHLGQAMQDFQPLDHIAVMLQCTVGQRPDGVRIGLFA